MSRSVRLLVLVLGSIGVWGCEDDSGGDGCSNVCWQPGPPLSSEYFLGWSRGEPQACNVGGMGNGSCPAGMACTGRRSVLVDGVRYNERFCEATGLIDRLVLDLPVSSMPSGLDVKLRFTMNGGSWPVSQRGRAGKLLITSLNGGGQPLQLDVPTDETGELPLVLPAGRYSLLVIFDYFMRDSAKYPSDPLAGTLEVAGPGIVTIDVTARRLDFSLAIDGAPVGQLRDGEYLNLVLRGAKGWTTGTEFYGFQGDRASGTLVLPPDTYTAEVFVISPRFPFGRATLSPVIDTSSAEATAVQLDVTTFPLRGRVLIDGMDPPPGVTGAVVIDGHPVPFGASRPATYETRVFSGSHHISLKVADLPQVGNAQVNITPDFEAGPATFDIAANTVSFSAEVRLNGAQLPDGTENRGWLGIGGTGFPLGARGPALVTGRVFTGAQNVSVGSSSAGPLPLGAWIIARGYVPAGHAVFDVQTSPVTIEATYNGEAPPPSNAGRGLFSFTPEVGEGDEWSVGFSLPVSKTGPLSTSTVLPRGNYRISYISDGSYRDLPQGSPYLGDFTVGPGPVVEKLDLRGGDVTIELRRQGMPLPTAPVGDRGLIQAGASWLSGEDFNDHASGQSRVPATGASEVQLRMFRGVWSLTWTCDQDCVPQDQNRAWLANGLRLP